MNIARFKIHASALINMMVRILKINFLTLFLALSWEFRRRLPILNVFQKNRIHILLPHPPIHAHMFGDFYFFTLLTK